MAASNEEPEEPNEQTSTPKITYTLAIFSHAELAKAQHQCEPVAWLLVLSSKLEWPDTVCAQLKIKACNVLFPAQATVNNDVFEVTFSIAHHVPMPLPLAMQTDYKLVLSRTLRIQLQRSLSRRKQCCQLYIFIFLSCHQQLTPKIIGCCREGKYSST